MSGVRPTVGGVKGEEKGRSTEIVGRSGGATY